MLFPRRGVHFSARKVDRSGVPLLKSNPIDNRKQEILEFEFHSRCLKIYSLQRVKQNGGVRGMTITGLNASGGRGGERVGGVNKYG